MLKVICISGARPNFMKIAPIVRAFEKHGGVETLLVHTGQHYDENMSRVFFHDLGIPEPDVNLEVGSASHAVQTAEIMKGFEPIVKEFGPDYVLVVGDVNSTVACGLVTVKLHAKLIHVEAGLRSFDRRMPEEINRIVTDSISDLLFVSEQSDVDNLRNEGVDLDRVHFVGNVMIDTLLANREKAENSAVLQQFGLQPKTYSLITLHRPSNVDDPDHLSQILDAFEHLQSQTAIVFPVHPRTANRMRLHGLYDRLVSMDNLVLTEPLGYLDFLCLMSNARVVMTDSGGIQEETTILGVPCMTLRENTERPVTITEGTNTLVQPQCDDILRCHADGVAASEVCASQTPPLWDGRAAERITEVICRHHENVMSSSSQVTGGKVSK